MRAESGHIARYRILGIQRNRVGETSKLKTRIKYPVNAAFHHNDFERSDMRVMFQASGEVGDIFIKDMSHEQYELLPQIEANVAIYLFP